MDKNTVKTVGSHGNGNNSKATAPACSAGRRTYVKSRKQDANLQKRGFIRFQIGLILAMLLVYLGLEATFKNMEPPEIVLPEDLTEVVDFNPTHILIQSDRVKEKIKPPKKTRNPEILIVDDDEPEAGLDEFLSDQIDTSDKGKMDLSNLEYVDPKQDEPEDFLINVVEEVPVFPGCERVKVEERLACFNKKMKKHVQKNIRYPQMEQELDMEGKVSAVFKIGPQGNIIDVQVKGPSDGFEKEAKRIIRKLPKMQPGKHNGKPVRVSFSIPINFRLR